MSTFLRLCFGAALLTACGTSSNGDGASKDGGGEDGASSDGAGDGDAAPPCYQFAAPTCARGKTCCYSGITGTCKDLRACTSSVQFECAGADGCNPGEACCVTIPPMSAIDTSALSQDGGLARVLMEVTATSFCSSTCASPSAPICRTSADCSGGATCTQLPEGNLVLAVVGAETVFVCAGGSAPPSEAGASETGGSDGAVWDASGGD